jgi:hypothetical protein
MRHFLIHTLVLVRIAAIAACRLIKPELWNEAPLPGGAEYQLTPRPRHRRPGSRGEAMFFASSRNAISRHAFRDRN